MDSHYYYKDDLGIQRGRGLAVTHCSQRTALDSFTFPCARECNQSFFPGQGAATGEGVPDQQAQY